VWTLFAFVLGIVGFGVAWLPGLHTMGLGLGASGAGLGALAFLGLAVRRRAGRIMAVAALTTVGVGVQAVLVGILLPRVRVEAGQHGQNLNGDGSVTVQTVIVHRDSGQNSIQQLQLSIDDSKQEVKTEAMSSLGRLAEGVQETIPTLADVLDREEDPAIRKIAVQALGRMGPPSRGVYPMLLNLSVADPSEEVQKEAKEAMQKIGAPTPADVQHLIKGLKQKGTPDVYRASLAQVLTWVSTTETTSIVPDLRIALADDNARVRLYAAEALWAITRKPDDVLRVFRGALNHRDPAVRAEAVHAMGLMGPGARAAAADLQQALDDPDMSVRVYAASAVWGLERDPQLVLEVLREGLQAKDPSHRQITAETLGRIGPAARDALPWLLKMLRDDEDDLKAWSAYVLGRIGPDAAEAVPLLKELAQKGDLAMREQAVHALQGIGPAALKSSDVLRELLKETRHPSLVGRAALALAAIGTEARTAIPDLQAALSKAEDPGIKLFLAQALWAVDPDRGVKISSPFCLAVSTLTLLTQEKDLPINIRVAAVRQLGQIGAPARMAVPTLRHLQVEENDELQQAVEFALLTIGEPNPEDVPTLTDALKASEDVEFQQAIVQTLWLIGPRAQEAVPTLVDLFKKEAKSEKEKSLRLSVVETLRAIGDQLREASGKELTAALPALIEAFAGEKDHTLRIAIAEVFAAVGPSASNAVEDLLKSLSEDRPELQLAVLEALASIKPKDGTVVDEVMKLLESDNARLRAMAILTLIELSSVTKRSLPAIRELMQDRDAAVRLHAAQAVFIMDKEQRKTSAVLVDLLKDPSPGIRGPAAAFLGEMVTFPGDRSMDDVIPHLEELREKDPSNDVRKAARESLNKIRGQ
jgi:HEAT repeat protein